MQLREQPERDARGEVLGGQHFPAPSQYTTPPISPIHNPEALGTPPLASAEVSLHGTTDQSTGHWYIQPLLPSGTQGRKKVHNAKFRPCNPLLGCPGRHPLLYYAGAVLSPLIDITRDTFPALHSGNAGSLGALCQGQKETQIPIPYCNCG